MPWKCPVCGHINPDDAEFCELCGTKKPEEAELEEEATIVEEPQPAAPEAAAAAQTAPAPAPQQLAEPRKPEAEPEATPAEEQPGPTGPLEPAAAGETVAEAGGRAQEPEPAQPAAQAAAPPSPPATAAGKEPAGGGLLGSRFYLEIVDSPAGELIGRKVPVMLDVFPRVSLGRSMENVIVIPDATVSRRHAVIERREDGRVVIRDLGSANGTYVYDPQEAVFKKIEEAELRPGMLIRLGSTTLRVAAEEA